MNFKLFLKNKFTEFLFNPIFRYEYKTKFHQIKNLLLFKVNKKRRIILRNSYKSKSFFDDVFKCKLNFNELRKFFFNRNLFAYSNNSEKEKIIKIINENCHSSIKKYLEYANRIISKDFFIFEKKYKFKNKINWHYSFFNDFYWSLKNSEKIDIHPKGKEIDVKYVWELNRHQHLPYLGFAYYISGENKYAIEFKSQILSWIDENPPLFGLNWYSGLEISIRLISWIFSMYFFRDSKEINNNKFFKRIFNSMFQHAYFLKHFYTKYGFNHTLGELFGLFLFCKCFENLKPIKKWAKKSFEKFKSHIFLQTRHDGTNIEQSVNYHRFVLEFFSLFYIIEHNRISKMERFYIERMYEYLLYVIKPDGSVPLIGDFDDGKALPLTFYNKNPYKELLNLGSLLFSRGDFKYISKKIYLTSILLLGIKGYEIFKKLKSRKPKQNIKVFQNASHISIRNNWTENAHYLFVDLGGFGPRNAPHSHSSITNFIYSYNGKNIINDSGTFSYNKSWKERNLFRSSLAHNVLTINYMNQAKINGRFAWKDKPRVERILNLKRNKIELSCVHNGFRRYLVDRIITTDENLEEILIRDKVIALKKINKKKPVIIDILFHFDKDTKLILKNHHLIINNNLKMEISSNQQFDINIKKFFNSPMYGIKNKVPMLDIHIEPSFKESKEIEIITKIIPINS